MKGRFRSLWVGILLLFSGGLVCGLSSCDSKPEKQSSYYETRWSDTGKDSMVYVNCVADNGNQSNFFMNYMLFRMLFDHGGYQNVYNYYNTHSGSPGVANANHATYSSYKPKATYTNNTMYSSPARRSSSHESYTSPTRSTSSGGAWKTPTSSPSRSTHTYSSPARSTPSYHSTPSRSYSSPSRSYSSPARAH